MAGLESQGLGNSDLDLKNDDKLFHYHILIACSILVIHIKCIGINPIRFDSNIFLFQNCLKAMQKTFHPECFVCAYCGKIFANSPFYLEDGLPYCEEGKN